jgi:nucleotidyltransferase AbiEii toxin of type IV toxin-antitoxin system
MAELAVSYALDHLWRESMGLPDDTKEKPLRLLAQLLGRERVEYALIGGVAVQLHTSDPRTTLNIDLAVRSFEDVPRDALIAAGFEHTGRFSHSDNWRAPGTGALKLRTAVQFSADDLGIASAVEHAEIRDLGEGIELRVVSIPDLIALKLYAADEPKRRARKRLLDIVDVITLLEEHPEVSTPAIMARLREVQANVYGTTTTNG